MPGVEVEIVVKAGYESIAFLLPPDDIRTHLRGRHREDEFRLSEECRVTDTKSRRRSSALPLGTPSHGYCRATAGAVRRSANAGRRSS